MRPRRILFICKDRSHEYDCDRVETYWNRVGSTGLYNSILQVCRLINEVIARAHGLPVEAKMVVVRDNNSIDREVHAWKPTDVIIEAVWVVPEKFDILKKLHPRVNWIVRLHSEFPFLAMEGSSLTYCNGYAARDVKVAANSDRLLYNLAAVPGLQRLYLPNFYKLDHEPRPHGDEPGVVHVGCFGAMRPLKNVLIQAAAAIRFAEQIDRDLLFHANTERVDQGGAPTLKNLRALFEPQLNARLVEHVWEEREEFLSLAATMDICMQVSLSETFNIVAADCTMMGVPTVTSPEVRWAAAEFHADPTNQHEIEHKLREAWRHGRGPRGHWRHSRDGLIRSNLMTERAWMDWLEG